MHKHKEAQYPDRISIDISIGFFPFDLLIITYRDPI